MKTDIRAAILGMGNMGVKHGDQLRRLPGVSIAALCSSSERGQAYNESRGTHYPVYRDFDEMLDKEAFDVLYVCLPPFAHQGELEKAARRGIHIFAEKPIAIDQERGLSMLRAVEEGKVKSHIGYHMRFGGAVKRLREYMAAGTAGRPTLYTARYECNSLHTPWWMDSKGSGGQILEQVIHLYDLALYTLGDASSVMGLTANLCHQEVPGYTVEDTSAVLIQFASGALGAITGSNCAIPDQWSGGFRIVFENLVADFTDHNHGKFTFTKDNNREEILDFDTDVFFDENEYFMAVLRGEKPELAPMRQGLQGLRLVAAATKSAGEGGRLIRLEG